MSNASHWNHWISMYSWTQKMTFKLLYNFGSNLLINCFKVMQ